MPCICLHTTKDTNRTQFSIVSIQTLLRTLIIFVCGYNPLCNQIPYDKYLQFNKALQFKYIQDTKHTVTQPAHVMFLSRDHHGLHIRSMFLTQIQRRARELDVRLNSPNPTQHVTPLARLVAMTTQPNHHQNLIRNAIISLVQIFFTSEILSTSNALTLLIMLLIFLVL